MSRARPIAGLQRSGTEVNQHKEFNSRGGGRSTQAVQAFFAPLTEAAEAMHKAAGEADEDPIDYVVLTRRSRACRRSRRTWSS